MKNALAVIVVAPAPPKMTLFEFENERLPFGTDSSMEPFEKPTEIAPSPLKSKLDAGSVALDPCVVLPVAKNVTAAATLPAAP